jgi:hypothetical protein
MTATTIILVTSMTMFGFVFGIGYFALLRRTTDRLTGRGDWRGAAVQTLGRIAAAIALLAVIAQLGAAPLLATFAGFLLARTVTLRRAA